MGEREDFAAFRRRLKKEHNISVFICARCGKFSPRVHLHHIKEIVYGGKNDVANLIPLCGACHEEWDRYDDAGMSFERFLFTPSLTIMAIMLARGIPICANAMRLSWEITACRRSKKWIDDGLHEKNGLEWESEFERQNEIFCRYNYCAKYHTLAAYEGAVCVRQEFALLPSVDLHGEA